MILSATGTVAQDRDRDDGYYGGMDLHLVCYGEGEKPNVQTVPIFHWSRRHHEFDTDYATVMSRRQFDSIVQIDIHGDEGHIWLPKKLIPPIHSGGQDGWWELHDLQVGYSEIHAKYRLNGLNKPKVKINRQTGHISVDGIEDFRGTCEEHNSGEQRRF
ncbi:MULTISPECIES: hypothetical protein [Novosphingobium]|uniref:Uncharacterized protein n=1 Tax=Novosphingobium pentaromativorans US6-1 TaxID=1088721 RepID=G6EI43_9SPHN|nr:MULTISPECIES: hypothetical protein [Novosphingobium]AIT78674.1 hypothetical protein JI59_02030 [Novosphingobium pentaromativorans US6-1]EHJ59031.1 hypothetical protein NSU_4014 [Novosphingobium pentaromativorans US6-1]